MSKAAGAKNRLKRSKIKRLKGEMELGRWRLNGETVKIAPNGKVLDGHHRLLAAIESKRAFETVLVTNAPEDTLNTMDTGSSRNVAETLLLAGHPGKLGPLGAMGKAAAWIINHETHGSPFRESPPNHIIDEWLRRHQDLEAPCMKWIELAEESFRGVKIQKALIAFTFFAGALNHQLEATNEFLQKFMSGTNIADGDPAGVLRNFFMLDYPRLMQSRNRKAKPTNYTVLGRILKCLQSSIDGSKMSGKLVFAAKEPLPELGQKTADEAVTTTVVSDPDVLDHPASEAEAQL